MKVSINSDLPQLQARIEDMGKQVKFAAAVALTRTAQKIKDAQLREMRDVFESPTPWTMSSLFVNPATKDKLIAVVWLKDFAAKATPAAKYLMPQIDGGPRSLKRFEKALQSVGALPAGYHVVPGEAAKLDAFGNMDRGQIVQILSYFKAFPEAGYKANMTDKRKAQLARGTRSKQGFEYFVGRPGDRLPLGVWQRIRFARGTAIKPVMIFVRSAQYKAIYDFQFVAKMVYTQEFKQEFDRAYAEAMRAAR
ncbi:hypothetical protein [Noviherbaspirillum sp. Root189]|uniref:hypothetical protein n=1 Tax=Noviherbaspirillum sp. Root189 TaxID=1736487 RepID=UPI00070E3CB9|nr:hypothetical protein [Noviherbaspirillum sp. Root189]KRB73456.1 hypothetical protein ASE07_06280 [Noviherbaspirillum sp. Root189]